jgi:UDP-glucose 4-epimerase
MTGGRIKKILPFLESDDDFCLTYGDGLSDVTFGPFVGLGSRAEYGPINRKITEDDPLEPTTLYGAAKVATYYLTRQLAAQSGQDFAWLRLFSTYGPGANPGWLIPMLVEEMLAGRRPKTTLGTQLWDYLYIDDVAAGVIAAAATPTARGLFNLGSGRTSQIRFITERIRDLTAPDMTLSFGEVPFLPDQIMHMEADITRLADATGWLPQTDIATGLAKTVAWHRAKE